MRSEGKMYGWMLWQICKVSALSMILLLASTAVFAQDQPNYLGLAAGAITALVPFAVPVLVYGIKLLLPSVPRIVLPFLALGFGQLLTFLASITTGGTFNVVEAALLGAAGVFVREVLNTLNEHGVS